MRIKQLTVAGFRGFNGERTIDFHERLTLIAAPNSHGKTSISEALEFLLFGETSKVAHADSKEEYKDSYRNRHCPPDAPTYIQAVFDDGSDTTHSLRVELAPGGGMRRFFDGAVVDRWPFAPAMASAAPPFVLQHALKYLLLVPPTERFQGFARLLGLSDLDSLQQAIVNLCTKPEASVPVEAKSVISVLAGLEVRLLATAGLEKVAKDFKRGPSGTKAGWKTLEARADALLDRRAEDADRLAALTQARDAAAARVYSGTVALKVLAERECEELSAARDLLRTAVNAAFLGDYSTLATTDTMDRLAREASLLDLGVRFIQEKEDVCPLCGQGLDRPRRQHIIERHRTLTETRDRQPSRDSVQQRVRRTLANLRSSLQRHCELLAGRSVDLLCATTAPADAKVRDLFGKANEASWDIVRLSATAVTPLVDRLNNAAGEVAAALEGCEVAMSSQQVGLPQAERLGAALQTYLAVADECVLEYAKLEANLLGPSSVLRQAIDTLAGTGELTLIIDMLAKRREIQRALRIRGVLESLKELKRHVEQTVAETMESAIASDLTDSVMGWYAKIRTSGDPDVHFSGFAMDRTKIGGFKGRRVSVKAQSYGVELASAVSSLSESKLNALGLCVSITSALRSAGPWEFLVLDDPIQSWDDEHEVQFIEVIRSLVEEKKTQVIVLSHKTNWMDRVQAGCRSLNGMRYQITGYAQDGPHLCELAWAPIDDRLGEVDAIVKDKTATPVKLQQAEEEIRIVASQLAASIAKLKLGRERSPHGLNSADVRKILVESGCEATLVDRVFATFGTTDDAHHAPKRYQPNAERIRQYLAVMHDLRAYHDSLRKT